jgi:hypothetical protein
MDVFIEVAGLIKIPFKTVFSRMNVPAKDTAHNAEIIIPKINKAAPTIKIISLFVTYAQRC